ncbi:hypothetical protein HY988_03475 [Candidatus Micrarchaeota archaeon]|nr:hypothetical protein [Candidatus Micrarchaeota archaeon]
MPKTMRISISQRSRALILFSQGRSKEAVVETLHDRYHPEKSLALVERTYFPDTGMFSISPKRVNSPTDARVVWTSWKDFLDKRRPMLQARVKANKEFSSDASRKRMTEQWKSPEFASAAVERARSRFSKMWRIGKMARVRAKIVQKPRKKRAVVAKPKKVRLKSQSEVMLDLWKQPDFVNAHKTVHSKRQKDLWKNLDYKEKMRKASVKGGKTHAANLTPEQREALGRQGASVLQKLRDKSTREKAILRLDAQREGGWETDVDSFKKGRNPVPIVKTDMEDAIDDLREMKKTLKTLPKLQQFLVTAFFGFEPEIRRNQIPELKELTSFDIKVELESAFKTLERNSSWKKLLVE